MDEQNFSEFFAIRLKERGMTLKQLSDASGITMKHLEALRDGNFAKLPPAPYLRGYLEKLGTILGFESSVWWETLKEEGVARSGSSDLLPKNRFMQHPAAPYAAGLAALVLALIYLLFRLPAIVGTPELHVSFPENQYTEVETDRIVLRGSILRGDAVLVNGDAATVHDDGSFEKEISLQEGMNTVEVRAKKFLGKEAVSLRQIFYRLPTGQADLPPTETISPLPES